MTIRDGKSQGSPWRKRTALVFLLLALCALPLLARDVYIVHILNMVGIFCLLSIGLNLVLGYCGQFSVGQAGFYAIGAYASALLSTKFGLSFWLCLPLSGMAGALAGLVVGPVLRLRGIFLGMSTLAFGEIVRLIINNWMPVTNGPNGISNIPPPAIASFEFSSDLRFYYLILVAVVVNYWVAHRMVGSRFGRAIKAIRDDQEAAEISGVWAARYKVLTWIMASFFAGVAGSLTAHLNGYISPDEFTFWTSVNVIFMLIIGGMGTLPGAILGSAAIVTLPEVLRAFERYRMLIYPVVVLIILIFAPKGIYGLYLQAKRWVGLKLVSARS